MMYEDAETTRALLKEVGARAFQLMHYDAIRDICLLAEQYLAAVENEVPEEVAVVQAALQVWQKTLDPQVASGCSGVPPLE
ncbi:hypothetical protein MF271_24150 (plasmid) [Deinococcus sp. KNUC1210]|uniref:hypothetical protein n=1 Tax=Deinococcus sp. KNUC1210 TaxID=2917691 RepID=UPI001EF0A82A|nr:hypothetical protein [Deinococcus sp. KNUC1210]ULH18055.1 hypothetical protein MF271_24150 [Deinococcus sp. KNUC1210]